MSELFEAQVRARAELDDAAEARAYRQLAGSVAGSGQQGSFDGDGDADAAVSLCLEYLGAEPGEVPDAVTSPDERLEWMCRPTSTMRRKVRLEPGWHRRSYGAMLGWLSSGKPVALLPRGIGGYCYQDPATGRKEKVTDAVAGDIREEAILFYAPLPARPLKARDLVLFVFGLFGVRDYAAVVAAALAVTLIGLVPAWANKTAFGVVAPSGEASLIAPIGALLVGAAVAGAILTACRTLVTKSMSARAEMVAEAAVFSRMLALPASFFKRYSAGDLCDRVSCVHFMVQKMVGAVLGASLTALFALIYIVQIGNFAPALAAPAFAIVAVQALLTAGVTAVTVRYEREAKSANARLSGLVTALLNGVQKIKLAGAEKRAFARWADAYSDYAKLTYNRPALLRALPALVAFTALAGNAAIYYIAAATGVDVADFMAFSAAYGQVSVALMELSFVAEQISQVKPMLDLVSPVLWAVPESDAGKPSVESLDGSIEVSGVTFAYGDDGPDVLRGLSFKVSAGEYVALVGKSGCGKSTILRLLLGFEAPDCGSVFYGPHDVQKVDQRSLRRHIGTVLQDGKLFMGDIEGNITLSSPDATTEDAWAAAEIAGIAEDIRKMPLGMHTLVSEGSGGMSGGQRQRLMIARAVCGGKKILIFDEATSALDNKTQKHVSDSLDALRCTRLVVAHRLSTIRHCDRILVVDGGRIAEEGSYDELLSRGGLFAELVKRQMLDQSGQEGC